MSSGPAHAAAATRAEAYSGAVSRRSRSRRRGLLIGLSLVLLESLALKLRGYPIGGNVVVRCRSGHLFTTIWLPGASVKSIRFAWWRLQWCPVGRHWSIVTPVRVSELSEEDRQDAAAHRDVRLP
jgi:hypothetical protein